MTINIKGKLTDLSTPRVMGILNLTPDSFYDGGTLKSVGDTLKRVEKMVEQGADLIDIGGMSSRPGAEIITPKEEWSRIEGSLKEIRKEFPDLIISIDTLHSETAHKSLEAGADIINDISGGTYDPDMIATVAKHKAPFVLMHMQGNPDKMQESPVYKNATLEVLEFLRNQVSLCLQKGIKDIIIDPGFGFGKTIDHNFELLDNLELLKVLNCPILVGFSRKSMVTKPLSIGKSDALNGTTVLNTLALDRGASILRVHDVKEAKQAVILWQAMKNPLQTNI